MKTNTNTEQPKPRPAEQRKQEILAAAKHIFAQNGFRRTKIEQIAIHLGVGKGTLYRYFRDKKSLFLAVFEQGIAQLRQRFKANMEPIDNPPDKVAAAIKTYFEFFDNDRELIEIQMQVRSEFKDEYRQVFMAMYSDYMVRIQDNLRSGIRMGIFRELDVEKTSEAISATLQGSLQSFYVREFSDGKTAPNAETILEKPKELLTDRIEAITALLLNGILKR